MNRRLTSLQYEAARANLSSAGVRVIVAASVSVPAGSSATYTVADARTRRVLILGMHSTKGDIRFKYGAAAAATDFPLLPASYFVVDAAKSDVLGFWNTTAAAVVVHLLELE